MTQLSRLWWPAAATLGSIALLLGHPLLFDYVAVAENGHSARRILHLLFGTASYLSAAWLAGALVGLALERRRKGRRRPPKLLGQLISASFFLAAIFATITLVFDQSMIGAAATSSVLIAIVGFSLRNVVADVFAGIALSIERPYRIGDWIAAENGLSGRIIDVNWRSTRLETRDQIQTIVPNGQIARQRLTNYSAPRQYYRHQLQVTLDHSVAAERAKKLLTSAVVSAPGILSKPSPDVRLIAYDASGLVYVVRYWVPSYAHEIDCRDAVLSAIDEVLRAQDVPPPQRRQIAVLEAGRNRPSHLRTCQKAVLDMQRDRTGHSPPLTGFSSRDG